MGSECARADDVVGHKTMPGNMITDNFRSGPPTFREWPLVVVEVAVVPRRFTVTEEGQREHRASPPFREHSNSEYHIRSVDAADLRGWPAVGRCRRRQRRGGPYLPGRHGRAYVLHNQPLADCEQSIRFPAANL